MSVTIFNSVSKTACAILTPELSSELHFDELLIEVNRYNFLLLFQEISQHAPQVPVTVTPPIERANSPTPPLPPPMPIEVPKETPKEPIETLPQIELKLPKRPIRDRLGIREQPKKVPEVKEKESRTRAESPDRYVNINI